MLTTDTFTMSFEPVFDALEIDADPFALCELHGRCQLGLGRQPNATLHYFLAGSGTITFDATRSVDVDAGTLVLAPAFLPHAINGSGRPGTPLPICKPAGLNIEHHLVGGDNVSREEVLVALCGRVSVGITGVSGILDLVRQPIVERKDAGSRAFSVIDDLVRELVQPVLGSKALIRALLHQCMIHLLRERLMANDRGLAWMAALVDEKLWSALRRMLDHPADAHSVESLADSAGMSRATFAKRFSDAYGSGPMELLRDLRMQKAASLLAHSELPVKRIAELVGLRSRSYFTRTFQNYFGSTPQSFRR